MVRLHLNGRSASGLTWPEQRLPLPITYAYEFLKTINKKDNHAVADPASAQGITVYYDDAEGWWNTFDCEAWKRLLPAETDHRCSAGARPRGLVGDDRADRRAGVHRCGTVGGAAVAGRGSVPCGRDGDRRTPLWHAPAVHKKSRPGQPEGRPGRVRNRVG